MSDNHHPSRHRVVVTGMGMITPLGHNVPDTWAGILAVYMDRKEARRRDRVQQFATVAAAEAMRQSQLPITDDNRDNIGIFMGTGIGGLRTTIEQEHVVI